VLALVMLLRGFTDAIMMRTQQAVAAGGAQGYLPPRWAGGDPTRNDTHRYAAW
jgi:heme/copper-type cytochrome/quinol oxidase subunit 1